MKVLADHIVAEEAEGREVKVRNQDGRWTVESHDSKPNGHMTSPEQEADFRRMAGGLGPS